MRVAGGGFLGRGVFACGCGRGVGRIFARCGRRFSRRRRRRAFAPFVRRCARTRSAGRQSGAGAIARDDARRSRSPPFGDRRLRARAGLARKRRRFDQFVIGARRPRLGVSQIRSRRLRDSFAGSLPRRNESPRRGARLVAQSESDSAELLASPSSRAAPLVFSALRGVTARGVFYVFYRRRKTRLPSPTILRHFSRHQTRPNMRPKMRARGGGKEALASGARNFAAM